MFLEWLYYIIFSFACRSLSVSFFFTFSFLRHQCFASEVRFCTRLAILCGQSWTPTGEREVPNTASVPNQRYCLWLWLMSASNSLVAAYAFGLTRVYNGQLVIGYRASLSSLLGACLSLSLLYSRKCPLVCMSWIVAIELGSDCLWIGSTVNALHAIVRFDGYLDVGKSITKTCLMLDGFDFVQQSDFNAFPWLVVEAEESVENFLVSFAPLSKEVWFVEFWTLVFLFS